MTTASSSLVVAAGVICWRMHRGKIRLLLIRPAGRRDVSFPKGKVDAGETLQEAAVRETREETALSVVLGAPLGTTEYTMPSGRDKVVHYWAAEVDDATVAAADFTPNAEIASVEWVSPKAARAMLTFDRDREVLDRFTERADRDALRTFAIIALRHGKAVPAGSWSGPDSTRPLEQLGLEQARRSARAIAVYGPTKLISSTAARCVSTVEPIATLTGLDIKATAAISQDAHEDGLANVGRVVAKRVLRRQTAVLCSHGPVLPDIIHEIARTAGVPGDTTLRDAASLAVGEFAVLHLSQADPSGGIVAVETSAPREA